MDTEEFGPDRRTAMIFAAFLIAMAILATPSPGWGTAAQTVGHNGKESAAVTSLSATSLTFGNQSVGTSSTAHTITLTNSGSAALSVTSIALSGTNTSDFAQTNNCGSIVAAGASCSISVTFTPTATGSFTADVTLTNGSSHSSQSIKLTGTGTAPAASLSPASLTFSSQAVGATSTAQTLTLTNSGSATLSVTGLALTGANPSAFAQSNTCGNSVAAKANCTINVTFTPSAIGAFTAALSIADSATGSPQTVSLSGTGTTASAAVTLSAESLAFGNQAIDITSTAQTATLTNSGGAALSVTSLALTGANASDFTVTDTCGSSVAAGANCTIAVLFTPGASGVVTAALSIADSATGSPQTVSLTGTGIHNVNMSWTPSATAGVSAYYVYRGTTSGGEVSTPLNSTPIDSTSFTDASVTAGATYYYVVTALASNDDTQSVASTETAATVP